MVPNSTVFLIRFLCAWGDITASMSLTWGDWFLGDKTSIADLHHLHNFSPHADVQLHESGAPTWTHTVMLGEKCFRPSKILRVIFQILQLLFAFAATCAPNLYLFFLCSSFLPSEVS